jgi:exonuclease SbcC
MAARREVGVGAVEVGDDDGGPVGGVMDAHQIGGRGASRQGAEDGPFVEVRRGERVVGGGGLDEEPASVGEGERGGQLVAEAARGGDGVRDGAARMSENRCTLVHSDDRASHGARSGLGLKITDAWSGKDRDTNTLSGGESFFASLSLALGLADVVTAESGGQALDTLFIDEGFGTLDEDTLHNVLDVLDSLRAHNRTVGVISHVPELRRRITHRLHVRKAATGSTLAVITEAAE